MIKQIFASIFAFILCVVAVTSCIKDDPTTTPEPTPHPYGAGMGMYSFFIRTDIGQGNITVYIDGQSKGLISHNHSNPTCGSVDVNLVLSAGAHTFSAQGQAGTTWNSTITVLEDQCNSSELLGSGGSTGGGGGGGGGGTSNGKATFWINGNPAGGNITVTCNGQTQVISGYYGSNPGCGAAACANFSFSPGTYSYSASNNDRTWSGSITTTSNGCATMQLSLGSGGGGGGGGGGGTGYGQLTVWEQYDLGHGDITVTVSSYSGVVTMYYPSGPPPCGANGCANFTLPVGTYNVSAVAVDGNTWNGSATVTDGGCYTLQLQ